MRSHLFSGTRICRPAKWHTDASRDLNEGHTWAEFIPYTNVLWIKYILQYLGKNYLKSKTNDLTAYETFKAETKELSSRLNPMTKVENGAFSSAGQMLEYVVAQGWVVEEQIVEYGAELSESEGADKVDEESEEEDDEGGVYLSA